MPEFSEELQKLYDDLQEAGVIAEADVSESGKDDNEGSGVFGPAGSGSSRLAGGDGDDLLTGTAGVNEIFSFDGRDDGNDEGRHVDVVRNFELDADVLSFRLDGGFFEGLDQRTVNNNQAAFTTARDIADLLLHLNNTAGDPNDDSFVRVVEVEDERGRVEARHVVLNFDDGNTAVGDAFAEDGTLVETNDITIVLEDFGSTLAAGFAAELNEGEKASSQDSVHIADAGGGVLAGGDGDNLFILSEGRDVITLDDRNTNNDEGKSVNIVHGFDLEMDGFSGRFDGGFFDGSNQASFHGAAGLLQLGAIEGVTIMEKTSREGDNDLIIELSNDANGRVLTVAVTDTTLEGVREAARTDLFQEIVDAGITTREDVAESRHDSIIVERREKNGLIRNDDGDDLLIATSEDDRFHFDSRHGNNDEGEHVDIVVGFSEEDTLNFRIDGKFFGTDVDFGRNNRATVSHDEIEKLGDFLNSEKGKNKAYFDEETNSTVLVIDDSPMRDGDELTIVLYDTGNLLV